MKVESPVETIVGAVVLSVAVGFAFYAADSGGARPDSSAYPILASFSSAAGVAPGTDVRIAGVKVGTVSDVTLDNDTFRAVTTMQIRSDIELTDDTIAVIDAEGLLGGTYVALSPGAGFDILQPGDEIENTQGAISLSGLIATAIGASGSDDN